VNEAMKVSGMRLGRRQPSNKPALQLARFLTGEVPPHPVAVDYLTPFIWWDELGNDRFGDCGPVSVANCFRLVSHSLDGLERYPSLPEVLDLYKRSGNPDFPNQDDGVDMQTMLEELLRNGIAFNKSMYRPVAFAKVDVTDVDMTRAAIDIFGFVLLGVDLRIAQQAQTNRGDPWDYVRGSGEWGGHAVMAGAYTSQIGHDPDISVVTWGKVIPLTDNFWNAQAMEAWVVIWPEHLERSGFDRAVDLAMLAEDYKALTGRELPLPVPPEPRPKPDLDPDEKLALIVRDWATSHHHTGQARKVAEALRQWIDVKGL